MEALADFSRFHLFLTFYESWTTPIACIHILCTFGNIYIEAFKVLLVVFVFSSIIPCSFSFAAPF